MKLKINYSHPYAFKDLFSIDKIIDALPSEIDFKLNTEQTNRLIVPFKLLSLDSYVKSKFRIFDRFELVAKFQILNKDVEISTITEKRSEFEMIQNLNKNEVDARLNDTLVSLFTWKKHLITKEIEKALKQTKDISDYLFTNELPELLK